jgi:hypothetical protein
MLWNCVLNSSFLLFGSGLPGCSKHIDDSTVQSVHHTLACVDCVRDAHAETRGQLAREEKDEDVGGEVHAVVREVAVHDREHKHGQHAAPPHDRFRQEELLVARNGAEVAVEEVAAAELQTEAGVRGRDEVETHGADEQHVRA